MVPWYEVEDYMHLEGVDESELGSTIPDSEESIAGNGNGRNQGDSVYYPPKNAGVGSYEDEEELKAIFERTFGPVKRYKEPQFKRTFLQNLTAEAITAIVLLLRRKKKNISL